MAERGLRVELWTGPEPELVSAQPGFTVRPVLPTWHPGDTEVRSRLFRLARRALRAAQLIVAWVVLSVRLLVARPCAVLWSQWRFAFEPVFVVVLSTVLRSTIFGIVAHEPVPRSDAKDTSIPKTGGLLTRTFRAAWQRLDVAFVLGPRTRELAVSYWQPRCPVHVIPHGAEPGMRGGAQVRPITETGPVALFFGVWSKYKGLELLLDAFERVRAELPESRLVLAGAVGADIDVDAVLDRARRIGNVEARPGYVPIEEVAPLFDSARVVVTPYIRATQSGVAHLAYTFGRPVIASAIGDLPEVIQDGVTGLLVDAGDVEGLARAMVRLLEDPHLAARLGSAGEKSVDDAWAVAAARVAGALAEVA
ncbi:glycosyltransferase family 4 protein [Mycobacterium sp. CVI_P3]|uniref:Glycosyltransferase family 4 protein n=1 Tax=Mycobacterium pinniadriaticum TaxID=2994102 RepID=A0ABT3SIZ7_9MYCO|nr:glycosyltransferase family 4 protein [Mycobacterium pinniadriaticum]MCX2932694.1 glycosyltransferase family 4 protein [Mycobacterium pinniadriaticum]MCX2939118.1 glycosyltransferase family 4 protein [Mycobacterium pinniadriaticum]